MTSRNYYWLIAGILCLLTALVHTIGGQFELVDPLMVGSLSPTAKVQWLGVWHVVTVMLFGGAFWLIRGGWLPASASLALLNNIAYLFVLFAVVFVVASIAQGIHALQWVLLLPIGLLTIIGSRRVETTNVNQELN
ncbi:MAG: hypothetical protein AAGA62_03190, partial [Bacteroidota bacterium]